MDRYGYFRQIQQLDPVADHVEICRLLAGYEFPWDITRALELALLRTFCVPSISGLLHRTGEFLHRPQKRYDDTGLLMAEMMKWGYDSPRGSAALQRMNRIHTQFPISNSDYLYVLSTIIYEPIRWIQRFGWRSLTKAECWALYHFWVAIGRRMGLQEIPPSLEAFEQFNRDYERQFFCYTDANLGIARATQDMLLSWFPGVLRPLIQPGLYALIDDPMREALGFPQAPIAIAHLVERGLKLRGWLMRQFPAPQAPHFFTDTQHRSYPQGYDLTDLGPPALLEGLNQQADLNAVAVSGGKSSRCPFARYLAKASPGS